MFISNLPGLPDNLSYSKRGTIWVPFAAVRNDNVLDFLVENGWLRSLICKVRCGECGGGVCVGREGRCVYEGRCM